MGALIYATAPLTIINLTLQNGNIGGERGSSGYCPPSDPTHLHGCGGGVYAGAAPAAPGIALTLSNVQVLNNTSSSYGGGVYVLGLAVFNGGVLGDNRNLNDYGGGFYIYRGLILNDTQVLNNTSTNSGGGGRVNSKVALRGGLFRDNHSLHGGAGGLYTAGGADLIGTYFINNRGDNGGGGGLYVSVAGTQSTIVNALFVGNQSSMDGAAISCNTTNATPGTVNILHTTISSPTLNSKSAIESFTGVVNVTNTIISNHAVGIEGTRGRHGVRGLQPLLRQHYRHDGWSRQRRPQPGGRSGLRQSGRGKLPPTAASAAIDRGKTVPVPVDFEGDARPLGCGFDIGFDESFYPLTMNPPAGPLPDGAVGVAYSETFVVSGSAGAYTYAITAGTVPVAGGLTLDPNTGVLSGVPTVIGTHLFDITATRTDLSGSCSTVFPYTLTVNKNSTKAVVTGPPTSFFQQSPAPSFLVTVSPVAPGIGTPTGTFQFTVDGANVGAPQPLNQGWPSDACDPEHTCWCPSGRRRVQWRCQLQVRYGE